MCGIFGAINTAKINTNEIKSALFHRGPDAQEFIQEDNVFLYHFRLSILDLEGGKQPMSYKHFHIIWNGEIYNHQDLRKKYNLKCTTSSDTETLLHLFDLNGLNMFQDLEGMFALAIYDSKNKKVLNLFAYTGSISVAAAMGGAHVTTVDMSNTYLNWAKDNFRLNHIQFSSHSFVKANTFDFLRSDQDKYDIIICDPPSFSNSKSMDGTFDVGRDHAGLILMCMNRLKDDGILYFSNNLRSFRMDKEILEKYKVKDITLKSIPQDFRDLKIHTCFEIKNL